MAEIIITTDGTCEGTSLTVDGADVTGTCKCTNINFYASAPYMSMYSNTRQPGMVNCSYEVCNDSGVMERKSIYSSEHEGMEGIGGGEMEGEDSVKKASIIRYIGQQVDVETTTLVDKIIAYCDEVKLSHPTREILITRSIQSLKDKAEDLGIKLEDSTPPTPKVE